MAVVEEVVLFPVGVAVVVVFVVLAEVVFVLVGATVVVVQPEMATAIVATAMTDLIIL